MRRLLPLFLLVLVLACGQTPPPRGTLPDAAAVVPEPVACAFLIGDALGVAVDDVIDGTGSEGVLEQGDLMLTVDGDAVPDASTLREILSTRTVGDTVTVVVSRSGEEISEEIVLVSNPEAPERPLLGVLVSTSYERQSPTDVEAGTLSGDFSRAASVGGTMYAIDPLSGEWVSLGVETPGDTWVAIDGRVLTLSNPGEEGSALVDQAGGAQLVFEVAGWNGARLLGTLGNRVLATVTRPVEDNPELVEVAVMLVDFEDRASVWIWPSTSDLGLPVATFPSPDGTQILVVGQEQETTEFRHAIISAEGQLITPSLSSPAGAIGLGWFDGSTLMVGSEAGGLALVDVATDVSTPLEVPAALGSIRRAWPVGDGDHLLAESASALVRFSTNAGEEIRTLADNCQVELLGDPGF